MCPPSLVAIPSAFDDVRRVLVVGRETAEAPSLLAFVEDLTAGGRPTEVRRLAPLDPLGEISQELRTFPADLVVIATFPRRRSAWLAHDVVRRASRAFGVPVAHVVVDDAAAAAVAA